VRRSYAHVSKGRMTGEYIYRLTFRLLLFLNFVFPLDLVLRELIVSPHVPGVGIVDILVYDLISFARVQSTG